MIHLHEVPRKGKNHRDRKQNSGSQGFRGGEVLLFKVVYIHDGISLSYKKEQSNAIFFGITDC